MESSLGFSDRIKFVGISDEFNKAGMQAGVKYVEEECLSLPTGKSSYNLSAAEQWVWAPYFGLLGLVVWNLLS